MPRWQQVQAADGLPAARTAAAPHAPAPAAPRTGASHDGADSPPALLTRRPLRTLADLIVPAEVQSRLDLALHQMQYHEELYHNWNLKKIDPYRTGTALNFYGPSGTGKSLAAEAIAERLGRAVLDVNYAEIESKYVGDTSKNIVRCFEQARASQAVLVFNEADSILGSRLSSVTQSADHSVNVSRAVMLAQLDTFDGLVVFTTNFPRNYDAAFVRRILVHVRFELPDAPTRARLWASLIPAEMPKGPGFEVAALAAASEGLAGGDMVNAIKAAGTCAIARPAPRRAVETADLLREIEGIRRAKAEVGKQPQGAWVTSVETIDKVPETA